MVICKNVYFFSQIKIIGTNYEFIVREILKSKIPFFVALLCASIRESKFYLKKDLANSNSAFNFAPVLCDSLIKKGRGKWPNDALAT